MTAPDPSLSPYEPPRPGLVAFAVFLAAGLTLFWPILTGQFLAGPHSDQYVAGYGFRLFGAEVFRATGQIPLWNPYLFGGLPFVAAMHGDVFYPTAWLRWVLPTDTAMNLGFAVHIVLAGVAMYAFLRALRTSWGGALAGGLAYELTGIVASLVHPGHDGKLFVSALTPLVFLAILRGVRDGRTAAWGGLAITVGLSLHGHPQLSYYLLVAAAAWGLWLLFAAPDRPAAARRLPLMAAGAGAVALGFGLYAIQALPFIEYIPFSPRGAGGPSGGWEYATAFSLPPAELMSAVLPEFNGIVDRYWGSNFFKLHTEYVGVIPVVLAILGAGDRDRRPVVLALGGIGLFFLLVALGGHTPFYRAWYEVMPLMQKVRAPGMAFFLVAFPVAALAGFGADRLLRRAVSPRRALALAAGAGVLGLLGAVGALQPVAEALALPQRMEAAVNNAGGLRAGGVRMLAVAAAGCVVFWAMGAGRLRAGLAVTALAFVVWADLWGIDRKFFVFQPPAEETYRDDEITLVMRQTPLPFRAWDPAGVYQGSWLMAHRVPTLLGYHGNELGYFDELLGGKNVWEHQGNPTLWQLYALRYVILPQEYAIPGFRLAAGPVQAASGATAYLYEAEVPPSWVTVAPAAARIPESQIIPTLLDPRFPADLVVLYPDTASVQPAPLPGERAPPPPAVQATVTAWAPGRITVGLAGADTATTYLLVAENWYPAWRAMVDGVERPTFRAQHALLSVPIPPGAREVVFEFRSASYERGRLISWLSLAGALALLVGPLVARRGRP